MKILSNLPDTDAGTTERPDGAVKDVSSPGAGDGTPFRADWHNDHYYGLLAVMNDAGIAADDSDEEFEAGTGSSQFLDALRLFGSTDMQTKNADFPLTDADIPREHTHFDVTTAAATIIATLPAPSATNTGKKVTLYKIDSGVGIIRATASFLHLGISQATIDIEIEGTGITFISNGTNWLIDRSIGLEVLDIVGTLEAIYTKFFQGTLDNDSSTSFAHGIADEDKIIQLSSSAFSDTLNQYTVYDYLVSSGASSYSLSYDGTNIFLDNVGANIQGNNYRARVKYYI